MPNESSAVARFIDLVQSTAVDESPPHLIPDIPDITLTRHVHRQGRGLHLAIMFITALIAISGVGVVALILFQDSGSSAESASAVGEARTAGASGQQGQGQMGAELASREPEANRNALISETGFDIIVKPANSMVSLDGRQIGVSPLRVRNLVPGTHVIDVSGPKGYFGQHMQIELKAGEAERLRLELASVTEEPIDETSNDEVAGADVAASEETTGALVAAVDVEIDEAEGDASEGEDADGPIENSSADLSPEIEAASAEKEPKLSRRERRKRRRAARFARKRAAKRAKAEALKQARAASASAPEVSAESSGAGTLMLGSKPPCDIILDGEPTGLKTPQRSMELSAGTHKVTLVNKELGIRKKFTVKIGSGKTTRAIQDFTSEL